MYRRNFLRGYLGYRGIPLLVRRGGCGIKKISAKPTLAPQTGWSLTSQYSGVRDHPVRFASSPPHEEGNSSYLFDDVDVLVCEFGRRTSFCTRQLRISAT